MSDDKFISDEELEQIDGGKAISRRKLDADAPIDVAPPGRPDGGAPGQGELTDEDLTDLTGGKALDRRRMDNSSDIDVAPPGHQDGGAPGQADHVTDPPTPL